MDELTREFCGFVRGDGKVERQLAPETVAALERSRWGAHVAGKGFAAALTEGGTDGFQFVGAWRAKPRTVRHFCRVRSTAAGTTWRIKYVQGGSAE